MFRIRVSLGFRDRCRLWFRVGFGFGFGFGRGLGLGIRWQDLLIGGGVQRWNLVGRDIEDVVGLAPDTGVAGCLHNERILCAEVIRYDREGFVGRAASASFFPRAGALYDALVARLGALFDAHAEDGRVELEGLTEVFLFDAV